MLAELDRLQPHAVGRNALSRACDAATDEFDTILTPTATTCQTLEITRFPIPEGNGNGYLRCLRTSGTTTRTPEHKQPDRRPDVMDLVRAASRTSHSSRSECCRTWGRCAYRPDSRAHRRQGPATAPARRLDRPHPRSGLLRHEHARQQQLPPPAYPCGSDSSGPGPGNAASVIPCPTAEPVRHHHPVASEITIRIAAGHWPPGTRLPAQRILVAEHSANSAMPGRN